MMIGRDNPIDSRDLLERISEGIKPRQIALEVGCAYSTIRKRIALVVHDSGCKTLEQAIAKHTVEKIKLGLPLAIRGEIERNFK